MSKRTPPPVGTGVVTIITVLLVLTLSVFSALTLTSARADLALSQTNADTVTAYYKADAEATALYDEFAHRSTDTELDTTIEMTATQSLRLHLTREEGAVKILAWQTVPTEDGMELGEDTLPVWDGN